MTLFHAPVRTFTRALRALLLAAAATALLPASAHEDLKPAKGGAIAEAGSGNRIELVREGGVLAAYLTDHDGKPLAAAGAKVEVTLLAGTTRTQLSLEPAAGNRLAKPATVAAGAKAVVRFSVGSAAAEQVRLTLR